MVSSFISENSGTDSSAKGSPGPPVQSLLACRAVVLVQTRDASSMICDSIILEPTVFSQGQGIVSTTKVGLTAASTDKQSLRAVPGLAGPSR